MQRFYFIMPIQVGWNFRKGQIMRDLGANPIPHLNTDSTTALRGAAPTNEAQAAALALSDVLIAELKTADTIVIGAPMYNFGIPSTLKAWFDYVLRTGVSSATPRPVPSGCSKANARSSSKAAVAITARARPAHSIRKEPHLKTLLSFMGIKDVTFIRAEKLGFCSEARQQALDGARTQLGQLFTENQYMRAA
jgi:FMN-dependent NADH-azoreductase